MSSIPKDRIVPVTQHNINEYAKKICGYFGYIGVNHNDVAKLILETAFNNNITIFIDSERDTVVLDSPDDDGLPDEYMTFFDYDLLQRYYLNEIREKTNNASIFLE